MAHKKCTGVANPAYSEFNVTRRHPVFLVVTLAGVSSSHSFPRMCRKTTLKRDTRAVEGYLRCRRDSRYATKACSTSSLS
jgi:hypothetical protein